MLLHLRASLRPGQQGNKFQGFGACQDSRQTFAGSVVSAQKYTCISLEVTILERDFRYLLQFPLNSMSITQFRSVKS